MTFSYCTSISVSFWKCPLLCSLCTVPVVVCPGLWPWFLDNSLTVNTQVILFSVQVAPLSLLPLRTTNSKANNYLPFLRKLHGSMYALASFAFRMFAAERGAHRFFSLLQALSGRGSCRSGDCRDWVGEGFESALLSGCIQQGRSPFCLIACLGTFLIQSESWQGSAGHGCPRIS